MSSRFGFQRGFGSFIEVRPDAQEVVRVALNAGRRARGRRLFLFVHFIDPHAPYLPKANFGTYSSQFIERFGPRPPDISALLKMVGERTPPRNSEDREGVTQLYDAAIAYVDENLGKLFGELENMGILQDSVVIVTADHGEGLYEHGLWQHGLSLYEEFVRVPLIVSWPDGAAGRVRETASTMDIFPTLIEAAGLDPPSSEGVNLKNYVKSTAGKRQFEGISEVTVATGPRVLISLRKQNLKYIATLRGPFDQISLDDLLAEEIYDIASDPQELENLVEERDYSTEDFREVLNSYLQSGQQRRSMWVDGDWVTPDAETKRKLKALGYVR
jgi:arylsulfatase A-like enzyme